MILSYRSYKFDVHWYFHQLRSGKVGVVEKNDIKTAHDAVRYCANRPIEYKLPKMGAYVTTTFNTDPNAVKYCSNTAKMAYIAGNQIFLGMFQIFLGALVSLP